MKDYITRTKDLIRHDQLEEAIDLVLKSNKNISDSLYNRLIQISHRNRHLDSIYNQGIVSFTNFQLEKTKICRDFLPLVDNIHNQELDFNQKNLLSTPEIKLLGEAQQNRFKKIITELVLTDKEIIVISKDINRNNERINSLSNSEEINRLKNKNKKLQNKLEKLEKKYELQKNEYNALKREKKHMKILTKIFEKKDLEFEEISKKNRFLEFEVEQRDRKIRDLNTNNSTLNLSLIELRVEKEQLNNILKNLENKSVEQKSKFDKIKLDVERTRSELIQLKDNELLINSKNKQLKILATFLAIAAILIMFLF